MVRGTGESTGRQVALGFVAAEEKKKHAGWESRPTDTPTTSNYLSICRQSGFRLAILAGVVGYRPVEWM